MTDQPWFIGERAEALAILHLTRCKELEIVPVSGYGNGAGIDLLVRVNQPELPENAIFAVEVKGERSLPHVRDQKFQVRYSPSQIKQSAWPVCVFLFNVTTEEGYYRWLYEPVIDDQNRAVLRLASEFSQRLAIDGTQSKAIAVSSPFEKLTNQALQGLVRLVTRWYGVQRPARVA